jgi:hypothetical protein
MNPFCKWDQADMIPIVLKFMISEFILSHED